MLPRNLRKLIFEEAALDVAIVSHGQLSFD